MRVFLSGSELAAGVVIAGSISIDNRIFERSTAQLSCVTPEGVRYEKGTKVRIYDDDVNEILFDGYLFEAQESWVEDAVGSSANLKHDMQCVGQEYLTDKRIIARAYKNQYAGDIVLDIINGYLGNAPILGDRIVDGLQYGEGVTYDFVAQGRFMREVVFNYVTVAEALTGLAEQSGYWWSISRDKILRFGPRTAYPSPFGFDSSQVYSVSVKKAASKYRNRQYVRGGKDTTEQQTEIQTGDANKRAYTMGFPVDSVVSVEVSIGGGPFVAKTVGLGGLSGPTDFDWYWNRGEVVIFQQQNATPLGVNDRVRFNYIGQFNIVVLRSNQDAIDDMKLSENDNTSGFVETVDVDSNIRGRQNGFDIAQAILDVYSVIGRTVEFETFLAGIKPGMYVPLSLPEHNVSNGFLIESVSIVDY